MNTVVLITGASTGFGQLTAETLARRGYTVFATMRDTAGRNAANREALQLLVVPRSTWSCMCSNSTSPTKPLVNRAVEAGSRSRRIWIDAVASTPESPRWV